MYRTENKPSVRKFYGVEKQPRPILLRELDGNVQKFLIVGRSPRTGVGIITIMVTGNRFLKYSRNESLNNSSIGTPWTQSPFRCLFFA